MRLDSVLVAIDRAIDDIIETEVKNVFSNMGPASDQVKQLETGFDRVNAFEVLVIEAAKRKFKP